MSWRRRYEEKEMQVRRSSMRRWFILVLTAFLLVGCGICGRVKYVPVETKRDSVYVETVIERKDTVKVDIPGETVYMELQDTSSYLETSVAESWARIDGGRLIHKLSNKKVSLEKEVVYLDKVVEKKVEVEKEVPVPVEVQVKYIPKYYKWIHILFWLFVIFIVFRVYFRFKS